MFRKLKEPPLSKSDVFADSVEDAWLTSPISGRFDIYRSHKALLSVGIDHAKLKKGSSIEFGDPLFDHVPMSFWPRTHVFFTTFHLTPLNLAPFFNGERLETCFFSPWKFQILLEDTFMYARANIMCIYFYIHVLCGQIFRIHVCVNWFLYPCLFWN